MITKDQLSDALQHANKHAGSQPSPIWIDLFLGRLVLDSPELLDPVLRIPRDEKNL